ncbi:MAG: nucleotidyltransferase family protein [Candidatus Wallbacteria bacterium]|nr:nucleotidyltransferase family protein [Candidatus Wallbacteria bacterium]
MEGLILAGGMGTRLQSSAMGLPKPMFPIEGKPFLWYLLKYLSVSGFQRLVISTGFMADRISDFFGSRLDGTTIEYSQEETPLGTGGAVLHALPLMQGDCFPVFNGDTFLELDPRKLLQWHVENGCDITIALRELQNFERYGCITLTKGKMVETFSEKKSRQSGLINAGVYVMSRKSLKGLKLPEKFSLETELLQKNPDQLKIGGFVSQGYFIDIGVQEDYNRACREIPGLLNSVCGR